MVRVKTSRPNWSVPNHQRSDGGRSRLTGAIFRGSPTKDGPITATTISRNSSTPPNAIVGLRRMAVASEKRRGGSGRSSAMATMSVADPRIEEGVGDVDHQVDQHLGRGEDQDQALDDRIVTLQHRVDGEAAEARDVEDG